MQSITNTTTVFQNLPTEEKHKTLTPHQKGVFEMLLSERKTGLEEQHVGSSNKSTYTIALDFVGSLTTLPAFSPLADGPEKTVNTLTQLAQMTGQNIFEKKSVSPPNLVENVIDVLDSKYQFSMDLLEKLTNPVNSRLTRVSQEEIATHVKSTPFLNIQENATVQVNEELNKRPSFNLHGNDTASFFNSKTENIGEIPIHTKVGAMDSTVIVNLNEQKAFSTFILSYMDTKTLVKNTFEAPSIIGNGGEYSSSLLSCSNTTYASVNENITIKNNQTMIAQFKSSIEETSDFKNKTNLALPYCALAAYEKYKVTLLGNRNKTLLIRDYFSNENESLVSLASIISSSQSEIANVVFNGRKAKWTL